MTSLPLVSVCIPCYNAEKYLRETVNSVRQQTYPNIEINIRDNASTDGTPELLRALAAEDSRIRVFRNEPNLGMAGNWNAVVSDARGEYVNMLSADDLLLPDFVAESLAIFERTDCEAVSARHNVMVGGVVRQLPVIAPEGVYAFNPGIVLRRNPFSINFTLFRRAAVKRFSENGKLFPRNLYTTDFDLWLRIMMSGGKVYFTGRPLAIYRWHEGNLSHQKFRMLRHQTLILSARRRSLLKACPYSFRLKVFRLAASTLLSTVKNRHVDRRLARVLRMMAFGIWK